LEEEGTSFEKEIEAIKLANYFDLFTVAFVTTEYEAKRMIEIGKGAGRQVKAVLSNMDEPLGYAIGNANEIVEAIETLKGNGPEDLNEVVYTIALLSLKAKGEIKDLSEGKKKIDEVINNGTALEKLSQFITESGGNGNLVNDYSLLPQPKEIMEVLSEKEGYVSKIKALGRQVSKYNDTHWNGVRQIIIYKGLLEKFSQNEDLKKRLLNTVNDILAECAVQDKIWGIGLSMKDVNRWDMEKWRGQNLLGFALMMVREDLLRNLLEVKIKKIEAYL